MNSAHRLRLSLTVLVIALMAPLSGCFAAAPSAMKGDAAVEESPTSDVTIENMGAAADHTMSFEDGAALTAPTVVQWSDDLAGEADWALTSPDDGEGMWRYTSADGSCTAEYWQGKVFDVPKTDDRAASDYVISELTQIPVTELATRAEDSTLGYIFSDNPTAQYRSFASVTPERSFVIAIRGFATLSAAAVLVVDCTSDRAEVVAQSVIDTSAIRAEEFSGTVEWE